MGVLEQNKVFKKTGLVAERFKAVVLKTIIAHTITSSNLVLPLTGLPWYPYQRTPPYPSRSVVVFDLGGTGAASGVRRTRSVTVFDLCIWHSIETS